MEIGSTVQLEITDIAFGGDGVARDDDGRVVFVPFTAVGDVADIDIVEVHSRFTRGRLRTIVEPGPGRVEPRCPHYGRCGGCRYQHLDDDTEIAAKVHQLHEVLERVGGFDSLPEPDPIVRSPESFGYRNKLRVEPIISPADADVTANLEYGFCELDNETFFALDSCPLAAPALNDLLPKAQRTQWARKNAARPYPGPLTLRVAADGRTELYFNRAPRRIPWLREELRGQEVSVPLGGFWQINTAVAQQLAETVAEWCCETPSKVLIDAYAGVGLFSLAVGDRVSRHMLIEQDRDALTAAEYNHRSRGIENVELLGGTAEKLLPKALRELRRKGAEACVVLDPPRSGCASRLIDALTRSAVSRIAYVSCNVGTLARDLKKLCKGTGFTVARLAFFDMFPQTAHFELAAFVTREEKGKPKTKNSPKSD